MPTFVSFKLSVSNWAPKELGFGALDDQQ